MKDTTEEEEVVIYNIIVIFNFSVNLSLACNFTSISRRMLCRPNPKHSWLATFIHSTLLSILL